jgi:hypothetical protein
MAEVMVSLIVFIVAVVGLVAMEARGVEAQRSSMETREGERLAQEVMSELAATGFDELVLFDFAGGQNPPLPYSDVELGSDQLRDYGAVPNATGERPPGLRADFFWVGRRIDRWPANGAGSPDALQIEVTVMWIDSTNPAFPPPADIDVDDLIPDNLDPSTRWKLHGLSNLGSRQAAHRRRVCETSLRPERSLEGDLAAPEGRRQPR